MVYPRIPASIPPQEFGDTMMNLGFNLVSLANNHTLDRGTGNSEFFDYWSKPKCSDSGSYSSFDDREELRVRQINGINYTCCPIPMVPTASPCRKQEYLVNVYTDEMLLEDIAKARGGSGQPDGRDALGREYTHEPTSEQRRLYAVGGCRCGYHHRQSSACRSTDWWIDDALCIYSLGNLISAQDGTYKQTE